MWYNNLSRLTLKGLVRKLSKKRITIFVSTIGLVLIMLQFFVYASPDNKSDLRRQLGELSTLAYFDYLELTEEELDAIYQVYILTDEEIRGLYAPFEELIKEFNARYGYIAISPFYTALEVVGYDIDIGRFNAAETIVRVSLEEFEEDLRQMVDFAKTQTETTP